MPDDRTARRLRIEGIVQGVGFRPFVARTATGCGLHGWVRNTGGNVAILLEGSPEDIADAVDTIRTNPPPLARIDRVEVDQTAPTDAEGFVIRDSADEREGTALVPPDTGLCEACKEDIRDPASPYHEYWATACVNCGPRFTVTRRLPYDRSRTSMAAYPFCSDCRERYEDYRDRRYHAQTTACAACGPNLRLVTSDGDQIATGRDAITAAADRLDDHTLLGIKGIGGTHLACEATEPSVVQHIRERLTRPSKPFALMAPDTTAVEQFADVTDAERAALTDPRTPIVVLERHAESWLDAVAPGLHTVGVMLPYAGVHHLLFDDREDAAPLVMTSANRPGVPMPTTAESLLSLDAVELALVHDREIVTRCDDSVVRVVDGRPTFLRRSRGWVPRPLPGPDAGPTVLALGGEFDATVAVSRERDIVVSQHVGDVDGPAGVDAHREATAHLLRLLEADPTVLACDRHPDFLTTDEASRRAEEAQPVRVQHHHAHAVSLLGENDRERAVVITVDGTGYGSDSTVWGGEVLVADRTGFERVGGLAPFGLPGGDMAVRYPARILATLLSDTDRITRLLTDRGVRDGETTAGDVATVCRQAKQGVNCPTTTSAGRYLDAVAALLGICSERNYQGQPAMELEATAATGDPLHLPVQYTRSDGAQFVDTSRLVRRLGDRADTEPRADVAATAQAALAEGLATIASEAAAERTLPVGITGGVALNDAFVRAVRRRVEGANLTFLSHDRVPPGDGGLAYGQALVALARR